MQPAIDARSQRRGRCRVYRSRTEDVALDAAITRAVRPGMHVYCHLCRSIQPLVIDEPQAGDGSGHYDAAIDLVCGTCHFIVATAYAPSTERERRQHAPEEAERCFRGEPVPA